jgi:hypothetical protein
MGRRKKGYNKGDCGNAKLGCQDRNGNPRPAVANGRCNACNSALFRHQRRSPGEAVWYMQRQEYWYGRALSMMSGGVAKRRRG